MKFRRFHVLRWHVFCLQLLLVLLSSTLNLANPANLQDAKDAVLTQVYHLQSSDATSMLEVVEGLFQGKIDRIAADQRTNTLIVVAPPSVCGEVEAFVLKLDSTSSRQPPAEVSNLRSALPATPAAKQLVEQLEAQELAAATAATAIRQLQANGAPEQNRQAIVEHQHKLANLLNAAFDLKLQLEELQVTELQSRLSRLERQIGQRNELREKIIARRAAELISGDSLRWNTTTSPEPSPTNAVKEVHTPLLQVLQGKWIIAKSVNGLGNDISEEQIAQSGEVFVDGTLFTIPFTEGDKRADVSMLVEIQSPSNPQGVKVTIDPNGIASTALGIIDCDSDRLRLCIGQAVRKGETPNEFSRPKVFSPGSDVIFLELRRKPTELPKSPIDSRSPNSPDPGIETIAAGLDASAAAINNMSFTTDYKKRHVYGLPFDAPIELTLVTKTIIDSEGRLRVATTGQQVNIEPDGKSARAYNGRWETAFQNGVARSLTWYESHPPTASIDNTPSLHGIHPREFTTHFQSKPVSEILRSSAAEVAERAVWGNRPVTIVQTTPTKNENDSRRYRFWIDQERNVVVRRAIAIRYAEGQPWQEYARIENHDYQQIEPGIWLPSKVKYESLEVTPELTPEKLSWSYEGINHDWKVNSELSANAFELAFPEGTVVNDRR